jgi:hypothetical protein
VDISATIPVPVFVGLETYCQGYSEIQAMRRLMAAILDTTIQDRAEGIIIGGMFVYNTIVKMVEEAVIF